MKKPKNTEVSRRRDKKSFRKTPKSKLREIAQSQSVKVKNYDSNLRIKEYPDITNLQYFGKKLKNDDNLNEENSDSSYFETENIQLEGDINSELGQIKEATSSKMLKIKKLFQNRKIKFCNLHRRGEFYLIKYFMTHRGWTERRDPEKA